MPESQVIDLRGAAAGTSASGATVLADPTGRRARRMRTGGRIVALAFAVWLGALVLAGLGLIPSSGVPLGARVHADTAPPALTDDDALVARAGSPPAFPTTTPGPARAVAPATTPRTTRPVSPATSGTPTRKRPRSAARKRPSAAVTPVATPTARAKHTPHATPTPRATPTRGSSGTAPGQTKPHGKPTPTATASPAATATPKPHGNGGGGAGRTPR